MKRTLKSCRSTDNHHFQQLLRPFTENEYDFCVTIHLQTDKNGYAFWCAPVGFIFCTVRLSVMLESSVARVDETHSYFVAISCVTLMTRYQMAMLTTQVLIMSYKR